MLEVEDKDKTNITLVINEHVTYKKWFVIQLNLAVEYLKGYGFLSFTKNIGKNIGKNASKNVSGKYSLGF